MKVLSIAYTDIWPWGPHKGIPSIFYPQKGIADKGHDVVFLAPQNNATQARDEVYEGIRIVRFRLPWGLHFHAVDALPIVSLRSRIYASFLAHLLWLLYQPYCLFNGIRWAARFRPDIVYVHSLGPAFCGYLISRMFKAKLVIRVYGVKDLYWKWDDVAFRVKEWRNYCALRLPADVLIITNDGTGGERLARKLGVPEGRIRHWRNGIDFSGKRADTQQRERICRDLEIAPEMRIVLSTCRLVPIYQADAALAVMAEVMRTHKDIAFVIAGDGPDRERMEASVRNTPEYDRIRFLGAVERSRIQALLEAADIFVLLAKHHNCTNTMWEALKCGTCIVTTRTDAIAEVLSDEEAVLVPGDDREYTIKAIEALLRDDERRQRLGRNAKAKAEILLESWPQRVEKEIVLLERLCSCVKTKGADHGHA